MNKNRFTFDKIALGEYGRKRAYTAETEVTAENIIGIIGETAGIFNRNKTAADYLWRYKNGDQPILYRHKKVRKDINNKVVENHAYEFVAFKVAQSYGEPIQYVSRKKDDRVNESVDILNDYMHDAFKHTRDIEMGEWQSAVGTGFKAIQRTKDSEKPFRIVVPTPLDTYIIYCKATGEPLLSVQDIKGKDGTHYKLCYSATTEYIVRNSEVVESKLHAFKGIPIVEYPNNAECLSDIELVISLFDSINLMASNRMDGVEQFIQSFMKFVNVEIDPDTFEALRESGAFSFKSNNGDNKSDVDILSQELNQSETQVAKDDLLNNALTISAIPNKEGNTGGDTQGAVELRNGWDFSKQRAKLKDAFIKESEMRFAELALNEIRLEKNDCPLSTREFEAQINHSPTDNLSVKVNALSLLLKAGIHPLVAIKTCGLWGDAEKVFLQSKPYLEALYKDIDSDIDGVQKKADCLIALLNAGVAPAEAAKQAGLEIQIDETKWSNENV